LGQAVRRARLDPRLERLREIDPGNGRNPERGNDGVVQILDKDKNVLGEIVVHDTTRN
jgi:hypothetical protein